MRKLNLSGIIVIWIILLIGNIAWGNPKPIDKLRTTSFDVGWRFIKDNPQGAEIPGFDDSGWRTLDLPHDWSIEDLPNQDGVNVTGPFSKASVGKMGTGYTVGGTAWYRKSFTIDKADADKIAYLQFDGVYMNSDVWINGKHLGKHPYGYTSFYYDLTPFLNQAGQPNLVAVQVKNEGKTARWYSGSGIYRHTWLTLVNPVHIGVWGIFVTTPVAMEKSAEVEIATTLVNSGKEDASVTVNVQLMDPNGKIVGKASSNSKVAPGQSAEEKQTIELENPFLWSLENPALYDALVTLLINNKEVDNERTTFGIRSLEFDTINGFSLNGKSMKLKGGCLHHDNGPLGAAAIDRAEERKIELLKEAGFNAIRTAHNPPSPALLDACDRLGMLVMDEAFDFYGPEQLKLKPEDMEKYKKLMESMGAAAQDESYSKYFNDNYKKDMASLVLRDRNHPSVIMWSIGNEVSIASETNYQVAKDLAAVVKSLDKTRPVTKATADNSFWLTGKSDWDIQLVHSDMMDIMGYNYTFHKYKPDHAKYPNRIMFGSETHLELADWKMVEELPYVFGSFNWTAMDYMGESGIYVPRLVDIKKTSGGPTNSLLMSFNPETWPIFNAFSGELDLIGNPKIPNYYQNILWRNLKSSMFVHRPIPAGKEDLVRVARFPDELKCWSWEGHEGEKMQVHVYTRSKLVKLELNGKPVGEQVVDDSKSITTTFEVPYEPGTLTARCYDNGVETSSETIKTVGKPTAIRLSADRSTIKADRNDLSYVMVDIIDSEGNLITYDDNTLVNFEISGNGKIVGVGSGSFSDMSSFQQPRKKVWHGKCLVIVRPEVTPGKIVIKAKSEGLKEISLEINAI
jgi:beta-galactosidase